MDLFTNSDLENLKNLQETPSMFLNEETFFNNMEGATEGTAAPTPEPAQPIYNDINTNPPAGYNPEGMNGAGAPPNGKTVNIGSVIPGKMAITVIDNLIPLGFSLLLKFAFDIKVKKNALQMTESEKKSIEPIITECLKTINVDFSNPWIALTFALTTIYGSKAAELGIDAWEKKQEIEEPATDPNNPAPFGFDENGNAKAPYGFDKDGKIKTRKETRGRKKKA